MIDIFSRVLAGLNIPLLTSISRFLDTYTIAILVLAGLAVILLKDRRLRALQARIPTLLITALIVLLALQFIKQAVNETRPCNVLGGLQTGKINCPSDGSFPSGHSAAAALFLPFTIGTPFFIPSLLFYIVVAGSRMYLGVHTLQDVIGGALLSIILYFLMDSIIRRDKSFITSGAGRKSAMPIRNERNRQLFHMTVGTMAILLFIFSGLLGIPGTAELLFFISLLIGMLVLDRKLHGKDIPIIDALLEQLERPGAIPGFGSFWLIIGVLVSLTFINSGPEILATLFILTFADSIAPIVGQMGRIKLPHNKEKTLEGTSAFFLVSLISWIFIGPIAIPLAFLLAIVESLPLRFDDNLLIPVAAALFFLIV